MSLSFPISAINKHQVTGNPCKRVVICHHVRNMQIDKFLKNTAKEIECDNEYTFRCTNLLTAAAADFLNYMFIDDGEIQEKLGMDPIRKGSNNSNFYVSSNTGEATMLFTSLTNAQIEKFVKDGNRWASDHRRPIEFVEITGSVTDSKSAESWANYYIKTEPELHHIFVTANMAARSFSVPKVVNGIMMVNEPGYASATQKYERLATIDKENENKIGNMYWFNFSGIKAVCPLYNVIYSELDYANGKKDIDGKPLTKMLDCINIFVQDGNYVNEKLQKWTEIDLFNEIHKNEISCDSVSVYLMNYCPELKDMLDKLFYGKKLDFKTFAIKGIALGKTAQLKIKTKSDKPQNKKSNKDDQQKEYKTQINMWETCTAITMITLAHDEEDRDFDNFYCDFVNILKDNFDESMEKSMREIWNTIFVGKNIIKMKK